RVAALAGAVVLLLVLVAGGSLGAALLIGRQYESAQKKPGKARDAGDLLANAAAQGLAGPPRVERGPPQVLPEALRRRAELLQAEPTDPNLRGQQARTHHRLGKLWAELLPPDAKSGEAKQATRAAQKAFEQAIREFEELAEQIPGEGKGALHLATCYNDL